EYSSEVGRERQDRSRRRRNQTRDLASLKFQLRKFRIHTVYCIDNGTETMRYRTAIRLIFPFLVSAAAFGQFPSPTLTDTSTKFSEHVYMTAGFPNVFYVVGDDATLVVDTGLGNKNGALAARVAKRLSKGPKLFLTTTHYHPEHAAGIGGFPPETIL